MINEKGSGFGKITEDINNSISDIQFSDNWQNFLQEHKDEQMPEICERACGKHYPSEFHNQWEWSLQENWVEKEFNIKRADIAFSNLCNLTCTMCGSDFSSEWIKLNKKIHGGESRVPWNFSESQVIELAHQLKNCIIVNIKGGEPFFNPRLKIFLKELANLNTNIHLPILTNGTIVDDEALEQFSRFTTRPTFCVSLESTNNDLYQLIRGGKYRYDDIKKNIQYIKEHYPKLTLKTNYVLGAWNIDSFKTDMKNLRELGISETNILVVHGPIEQSVHIINTKARQKWIEVFKKELEDYPDFYRIIVKDGWSKSLIDNMKQLDFKNESSIKMLAISNSYIKIRKQTQGFKLNANTILDLVPNYLENMK
jgi:MoaA/NifB/PqqE/SkfB family radical SAM enzyme